MAEPPAPWVGPFFACGECGGTIGRWPMTNVLRQRILDWKHVDVPAGTAPHRAVLGTPVPEVRLALVEPEETPEGDDEVVPDEVPPPEVPARPANDGELPSSAASMRKLAAAHGWLVEAWYMRGTNMTARWQANRVVEDVVLRMKRDGHRLIACWQTDAKGKWGFELGFSLTHFQEQVAHDQIRRLIEAPRMVCDDCLEAFECHPLVNGRPVCFTVLRDEHKTLEAL